MSTSSGHRYVDVLENWRRKRGWCRIEARAVAAHQRDQLAALRRLAMTAVVITDLDTEQAPSLGAVTLLLPNLSLTLTGVAPATRTALTVQAEAAREFRLIQAGRYGPHWWITVFADPSPVVVLSSRLRLIPANGGTPHRRPARPHLSPPPHQRAPVLSTSARDTGHATGRRGTAAGDVLDLNSDENGVMTPMTAPRTHTIIDSAVGPLTLVATAGILSGIYMHRQRHRPATDTFGEPDDTVFTQTVDQLCEYFAGLRSEFSVPIAPIGTPFQQRVWAVLREVPYGHTVSYRQLADQIGQPTASRAVGLANGRNPISIIIPCHRVLGSTGRLTGYGGGLERKQQLLDFERRVASARSPACTSLSPIPEARYDATPA